MTSRAALAAVGVVLALVATACAKPVTGEAARGGSVPQTTTTGEAPSTTTSDAPPTTTEEPTETSTSLDTPATTIVDDEPATEIVTVSPFDEQSRLRIPIEKEEPPIDGFTCEQSVLRPGMLFECGPSAAYLPACWPFYIEEDTTLAPAYPLYCMRDPFSETVIEFYPADQEIQVTHDADDVTDASAMPWSMELGDGEYCSIRIGGAWGVAPDGYVYSYGCDGSDLLLARDSDGQTVDRSASVWTVTAQRGDEPDVVEIPVLKAYFAGPSPAVVGPRLGAQCPSADDLAAVTTSDWELEPDQIIVCADDWAVATGWPKGDPDRISWPRLYTSDGEQWTMQPESDYCEDKQGSPLLLLTACYAG